MESQTAILRPQPTLQTWDLDVAHSTAQFAIKHLMIATVRGRVPIVAGRVEYDPERPEASKLEAELDIARIDTGVEARDAHLRSPDFFHAADFPTIRFVATGAEATSENTGRVHGELTMRGVTRPVTLDVEFEGEARDPWGKRRAAFSASATIDRRDWGLEWNQALEAGGWLVGDKVKVELNVQLVERTSQ